MDNRCIYEAGLARTLLIIQTKGRKIESANLKYLFEKETIVVWTSHFPKYHEKLQF